MIRDIARALGQTGDPRFRRVLFLGLGITVGLLIAFYIATGWLVAWAVPDDLTVFGYQLSWLNDIASGVSVLGALLLSSFLMVPVASAFTGMFLDQVADAVEDRHYPGLPPARATPILENIADSLGFLGVMIVANLAALVLYLIFAPFAPLIFWALNGFLLGREYFQLVAIRRLGPAGAKAMRKRYRGRIWLMGGLMAVPLTVPLLNLVVPIIGAAAFTHFYHRLARDPGAR